MMLTMTNIVIDNDWWWWQWLLTSLKFWWRSNDDLGVIINHAAPCPKASQKCSPTKQDLPFSVQISNRLLVILFKKFVYPYVWSMCWATVERLGTRFQSIFSKMLIHVCCIFQPVTGCLAPRFLVLIFFFNEHYFYKTLSIYHTIGRQKNHFFLFCLNMRQ